MVFGQEEEYFRNERSDSISKYFEDDIIKLLEFLVDIIFVVFAEKVFQQIVGIPNEHKLHTQVKRRQHLSARSISNLVA